MGMMWLNKNVDVKSLNLNYELENYGYFTKKSIPFSDDLVSVKYEIFINIFHFH